MDGGDKASPENQLTKDVSLKDLSSKLDEYAKARDWRSTTVPEIYSSPWLGRWEELSEIFQWRGEVERGLPDWKESDKEHLGKELSDVLLYLVRLADIYGVDLGDAANMKIAKNGIKYPTNNNS